MTEAPAYGYIRARKSACGMGLPYRYPCMLSQPIDESAAA